MLNTNLLKVHNNFNTGQSWASILVIQTKNLCNSFINFLGEGAMISDNLYQPDPIFTKQQVILLEIYETLNNTVYSSLIALEIWQDPQQHCCWVAGQIPNFVAQNICKISSWVTLLFSESRVGEFCKEVMGDTHEASLHNTSDIPRKSRHSHRKQLCAKYHCCKLA